MEWFVDRKEPRLLLRSGGLFLGTKPDVMKYYWFILPVFLAACGGSLSDEQRKKIQEEMRNSKITRVSEVQITEAAFAKGRAVVKDLKILSDTLPSIDSIESAEHVKISLITTPSYSKASEIERSIFDAYESTPVGSLQDNIQKIRNQAGEETDSLLYSKPVVINRSLKGAWNVWLSRKQLVLSLTEKR